MHVHLSADLGRQDGFEHGSQHVSDQDDRGRDRHDGDKAAHGFVEEEEEAGEVRGFGDGAAQDFRQKVVAGSTASHPGSDRRVDKDGADEVEPDEAEGEGLDEDASPGGPELPHGVADKEEDVEGAEAEPGGDAVEGRVGSAAVASRIEDHREKENVDEPEQAGKNGQEPPPRLAGRSQEELEQGGHQPRPEADEEGEEGTPLVEPALEPVQEDVEEAHRGHEAEEKAHEEGIADHGVSAQQTLLNKRSLGDRLARGRAPLPRLIVNLKAYPQTLGRRAVALCHSALGLEREFDVPIVICPQAADLRPCAETGARVFAQHLDKVVRPEATGWQSAEVLVDAGCSGVLLNHSEHRLPGGDVGWYVDAARGAHLVSVLCTRDNRESEALAATRPDLVAVEPPELIGGDVAVTTADPEVVRRSVLAVQSRAPGTPVLCGAGVKSAQDVARAVELGAHGILVASGVTKAPDPAKALRHLASGFRD